LGEAHTVLRDYDAKSIYAFANGSSKYPLAGVRGKYGKLLKLTAPHFCFMKICGVLGFTINNETTNFS